MTCYNFLRVFELNPNKQEQSMKQEETNLIDFNDHRDSHTTTDFPLGKGSLLPQDI